MTAPKLIIGMACCLLGLFSCQSNGLGDTEILAKVYGERLSLEALAPSVEGVDSAASVQAQVEAWALRQLWAHAASDLEYTPRMERMVEDYKNSLIIAAYQKDLIAKSNVQIDEQKVLAYYKENSSSFLLEKEMFKLQFFLLREDMDIVLIDKQLDEGEVSSMLTSYCETNPANCMSSPVWVDETTLEAIGLPSYLWKTSGKFLQYYGVEGYVLLYRIEAKRNQGEAIPLDLVKDKIVSILSFQAEQDIIQKHEAELLQRAQNENSFEIY